MPLKGNGGKPNGGANAGPWKKFPGINTARQYAKFRGKYPRMGRDFPRRYVDVTPDEILYDPTRILSRGVQVRRCEGSGETVMLQPRVETEAVCEETNTSCPPTTPPFTCPPPFSQLPVVKKQIHLEPSRDAEIFFSEGSGYVPPSSSATILTFETMPTLRTIIRWTKFFVAGALNPSQIALGFRIEGQPMKWVANPMGAVVASGGNTYGTVTMPSSLDLQWLPDCCINSLIEITDRRIVQAVVVNTNAIVDRFVRVCVWGWVESISMWDNAVKH